MASQWWKYNLPQYSKKKVKKNVRAGISTKSKIISLNFKIISKGMIFFIFKANIVT